MILLAHPYVLRDDAKQFERMKAFSNFAALNCVVSLDAFAAGLARLLRSGAPALLVMFGTRCPVAVVQFTRGDAHSAVSRRGRGPVPARLCGRDATSR